MNNAENTDFGEYEMKKGQASRNLRKGAKLKMGFPPIVSFTKHHLP